MVTTVYLVKEVVGSNLATISHFFYLDPLSGKSPFLITIYDLTIDVKESGFKHQNWKKKHFNKQTDILTNRPTFMNNQIEYYWLNESLKQLQTNLQIVIFNMKTHLKVD